jgi:1-acyl-sn-glycerol-3-phosphate acyltransferase
MPVNCLTTESFYQTPERTRPGMTAWFPGVVFYAKVFGVICRAAKLAKHGGYDSQHWIESSVTTVRALESVGGSFDLQNLDVPRQLDSPCVFIGNHMSILETFVLPCLIQPHRPITFVVKESLITYPLFGHVMRSRDPVVVGRTHPREDLRTVLEEGEKRLAANISVVIFPQTTRSVDFDPQMFNSLGVKLAKRCKVPVVPFALKTDAWGVGRRLKDFGRICPEKTVHIHFGEPMTIHGSGKEEHQMIVGFIGKKMAAWK